MSMWYDHKEIFYVQGPRMDDKLYTNLQPGNFECP